MVSSAPLDIAGYVCSVKRRQIMCNKKQGQPLEIGQAIIFDTFITTTCIIGVLQFCHNIFESLY